MIVVVHPKSSVHFILLLWVEILLTPNSQAGSIWFIFQCIFDFPWHLGVNAWKLNWNPHTCIPSLVTHQLIIFWNCKNSDIHVATMLKFWKKLLSILASLFSIISNYRVSSNSFLNSFLNSYKGFSCGFWSLYPEDNPFCFMPSGQRIYL